MRQLVSSPTPRAQATAALIGDTWVTTTTSRSTASAHRSSHAARTRAPRAASDSPPSGTKPRSRLHCRHKLRGGVERPGRRRCRSRSRSTGRRRSTGGPSAAAVSRARLRGLLTTRAASRSRSDRPRASACRRPSSSRGTSIRPAAGATALCAVRPWRTRSSTAGDATRRLHGASAAQARPAGASRGSATTASGSVGCGAGCLVAAWPGARRAAAARAATPPRPRA